MIITSAAQKILNQPDMDYWARLLNGCYKVDAVDFGSDAYRLAGPFNERYGLVYLSYTDNAEPYASQVTSNDAKRYHTITYMPYRIRQKIEDFFGSPGTEYWIQRTPEFRMISELDYMLMGIHERSGFFKEEKELCGHFWATERALEKIMSLLTEAELAEWQQNCKDYKAKAAEIDPLEMVCAERPCRLLLTGTDDALWSRAYESESSAEQALQNLHANGFVYVDTELAPF